MAHHVVSAFGADRPGIVARITQVLHDHGGNLADSHMGLLSGRFTIMLVVELPGDAAGLEEDLRAAARELGLDGLHVEAAPGVAADAAATHVVTVYGADHPGIVAAVTEALARAGASVTDLRTRLAGELYVMTIEVSGGEGAEAALAAVAAEQAVEMTVRPLDDDVL